MSASVYVNAFDAFTQTHVLRVHCSEWFIRKALKKSNAIYYYLPFLLFATCHSGYSSCGLLYCVYRRVLFMYKLESRVCLLLLTLFRWSKSCIRHSNYYLANWVVIIHSVCYIALTSMCLPNRIGYFFVLLVLLHAIIVLWNWKARTRAHLHCHAIGYFLSGSNGF